MVDGNLSEPATHISTEVQAGLQLLGWNQTRPVGSSPLVPCRFGLLGATKWSQQLRRVLSSVGPFPSGFWPIALSFGWLFRTAYQTWQSASSTAHSICVLLGESKELPASGLDSSYLVPAVSSCPSYSESRLKEKVLPVSSSSSEVSLFTLTVGFNSCFKSFLGLGDPLPFSFSDVHYSVISLEVL